MGVLAYNHYRSISLPSRLIHPNKIENHELLHKQISNNLISETVPITSEAVQSGLLRLAQVYNSLEEATQCPGTQRSILTVDHHDQDRKSTEESLETSMELLDSCTSTRELVLMIRENVNALQSSLRRLTVGSTVENDVRKYSCFRKRTNRSIAKSLKTLKNLEISKNRVLSEVAGFTIVILRSILVFLSWPTGKSGTLNIVSRLMQIKSMAVRREDSVVDVQVMEESLKKFDVILEEFEVGLERLFRQLVRNRVLLLNVLTHHLR